MALGLGMNKFDNDDQVKQQIRDGARTDQMVIIIWYKLQFVYICVYSEQVSLTQHNGGGYKNVSAEQVYIESKSHTRKFYGRIVRANCTGELYGSCVMHLSCI